MTEEAFIKTVCSKCGTVYELDRSLIGQQGECAECGAAFEICDQTDYVNQMLSQSEDEQQNLPSESAVPDDSVPSVEEVPAEDAPVAQTDDAAGPVVSKNESAPTNTVKLPRFSKTGMMPDMKGQDNFKIGTINASTQTAIGSSRGSRRFSVSRSYSSSSKPVKKKRWWEFWK